VNAKIRHTIFRNARNYGITFWGVNGLALADTPPEGPLVEDCEFYDCAQGISTNAYGLTTMRRVLFQSLGREITAVVPAGRFLLEDSLVDLGSGHEVPTSYGLIDMLERDTSGEVRGCEFKGKNAVYYARKFHKDGVGAWYFKDSLFRELAPGSMFFRVDSPRGVIDALASHFEASYAGYGRQLSSGPGIVRFTNCTRGLPGEEPRARSRGTRRRRGRHTRRCAGNRGCFARRSPARVSRFHLPR
jgi:hypothetical protein